MHSNSFTSIINSGVEKGLSQMNKIIWGKVVKVNESTIDIQPSFKGKYNDVERDLPLLVDVLPIFLQGGGSYRADPINIGDFAVVFIADRCIEQWYNGNDNQLPRQYRMHDLSDAFAIVGINQLATAIAIPSVITEIGDKYIEGNYEHIGNIEQTGNLTITGNLVVNGNITINSGDLTIDGVSFKNHTHLQNDGNDAGGGVQTNSPTGF